MMKRQTRSVAPTFRHDIFRTADLAEEVAGSMAMIIFLRPFQRERLPQVNCLLICVFSRPPETWLSSMAFLRDTAIPFESPKVFDKLLLSADDPHRQAIVIANPLGEDFSIMRTLSLNGMLTSLGTNYKRRNKNVRLYELGISIFQNLFH